jgi:hypothetical protein
MPFFSNRKCDVRFVGKDGKPCTVECFIVGRQGPHNSRVVKCGLERDESILVENGRVSNIRGGGGGNVVGPELPPGW